MKPTQPRGRSCRDWIVERVREADDDGEFLSDAYGREGDPPRDGGVDAYAAWFFALDAAEKIEAIDAMLARAATDLGWAAKFVGHVGSQLVRAEGIASEGGGRPVLETLTPHEQFVGPDAVALVEGIEAFLLEDSGTLEGAAQRIRRARARLLKGRDDAIDGRVLDDLYMLRLRELRNLVLRDAIFDIHAAPPLVKGKRHPPRGRSGHGAPETDETDDRTPFERAVGFSVVYFTTHHEAPSLREIERRTGLSRRTLGRDERWTAFWAELLRNEAAGSGRPVGTKYGGVLEAFAPES